MTKRIVSSLLALALIIGTMTGVPAIITGCSTSQQRTAVNSLFTVGNTVDSAYKAYLDGVVAGAIKTNDVPEISRQYVVFQRAFAVAVETSALSSNAPPSVELSNAASQLLLAIQAARQKGK